METDGGQRGKRFGENCAWVRCSSEPVPSCLTSFLLIVSVTITSVLLQKHKSNAHLATVKGCCLCLTGGGGSLETCVLVLPSATTTPAIWGSSSRGRPLGQHHGSVAKGQLFHWSALASYFLHHLGKRLVEKRRTGSIGVAAGYSSEACHSNES